MYIIDIIFTGIGLSMDAVAISICKGLMIKRHLLFKALVIGLYFGLFQLFMPLVGYFFGNFLDSIIIDIDHWIAFSLLSIIGFNMIKDSKDDDNIKEGINYKIMIPLSIATSIDALTIGISFSFFKINILFAVIIIGFITFLLSFCGVYIGNIFGLSFKKKSQICGGMILIFIGLKILIEHLL